MTIIEKILNNQIIEDKGVTDDERCVCCGELLKGNLFFEYKLHRICKVCYLRMELKHG